MKSFINVNNPLFTAFISSMFFTSGIVVQKGIIEVKSEYILYILSFLVLFYNLFIIKNLKK